MKYNISKKFHFRECTLESDYLYDYIEEKFESLINSEVFREALFVCNPNIIEHLKTPLKHSVKNYSKRAVTRPTPFGLFSAVGVGEFGDYNFPYINNNYQKYVDVDARWLMSILEVLENDETVILDLYVLWNQFIVERKYLYKITNLKAWGNMPHLPYEKNIKKNPILEMVKEMTTQPILVKDLIRKISKLYTSVGTGELLTFIKELVRKELLISSLKPSIVKKFT